MPAESSAIVHLTRGGFIMQTIGGNLAMPYSEPCSWSCELDNSEKNYGPFSPVSQVRENEGVYHKIHVTDPGSSSPDWGSTELIVEDYEYDTDTVTISGRCRLAELDRDDQVLIADTIEGVETSTAEGWTVADLCTALCAHVGLTCSGAPVDVVTEFHLVGNPLSLLRDLLEPRFIFRMSRTVSGRVEILSAVSHPSAGNLKDDEDLELLKFRRSTDIRNRATVERLVPRPAETVLFDESRSGGGELGPTANGPHSITPSRNFRFTVKEGYRGSIVGIVLRDEDGDPVGPTPFNQPVYVGVVPVHSFTFVYNYSPGANTWGPWTPNWRIQIVGTPADVDPVPEEGYSETHTVGGGTRPYPEPFSSVAIGSAASALAAAVALVEKGTREGQILQLATRLRSSKIFTANASVGLEDYHSSIDSSAILESVSISWDEGGDTGTIGYDCTMIEVS